MNKIVKKKMMFCLLLVFQLLLWYHPIINERYSYVEFFTTSVFSTEVFH